MAVWAPQVGPTEQPEFRFRYGARLGLEGETLGEMAAEWLSRASENSVSSHPARGGNGYRALEF